MKNYFFYIFLSNTILVLLTTYLTLISTLSTIVFAISLTEKFSTPDYRRLRGFLFIFLGLSAGAPIIHYNVFL
jgi:hypothetical protein